MDALLKEIELRKDYLGNEPVETIYFGGGTPSILETPQLARIFEAIYRSFPVSDTAEITLEANPDDIDAARLKDWATKGINRLSIGVQSFFDADLKWMNRAHDASQAIHCILQAQDAGFDNLSIDLIYGTPELSDEHWKFNMEKAAGLKIPHLSCYALTVEPGTALDVMTKKKTAAPVNQEDQARQFLMMTDFLEPRGYEHYEISNLSLPGKRSKHNSAYWEGKKYLGLGPSAHSFNGRTRQWNIANNPLYIQSLRNGLLSFEEEQLSSSTIFNEYVMTSIRTIEGMDLGIALSLSSAGHRKIIEGLYKNFIQKGWAKDDEHRIVLTKAGRLFADHIASEMFMI